jgi:hypothetical protein
MKQNDAKKIQIYVLQYSNSNLNSKEKIRNFFIGPFDMNHSLLFCMGYFLCGMHFDRIFFVRGSFDRLQGLFSWESFVGSLLTGEIFHGILFDRTSFDSGGFLSRPDVLKSFGVFCHI